MRTRHRAAAGLLATLTLAATGCGGARGWVADHPDVATRARAEPAAFVAPTSARWDGLVGLTGSYTLRASRGVGRRAIDTLIAAQRPGNLDIVFYDPTGAIQAYLRANPNEVGVYFKEDGVLYRGPSRGDGFARALGLGMRPEDAVALLLGFGVDRVSRGEPVSRWDEEARRIRMEFDGGLSAWLHPVLLRVERVEHRDAASVITSRLGDWRTLPDDLPVPGLLSLRAEPDGLELAFTLVGEPGVNPAFPVDFFDLQVTESTLQLPLSELARDGGLLQRAEPEEAER